MRGYHEHTLEIACVFQPPYRIHHNELVRIQWLPTLPKNAQCARMSAPQATTIDVEQSCIVAYYFRSVMESTLSRGIQPEIFKRPLQRDYCGVMNGPYRANARFIKEAAIILPALRQVRCDGLRLEAEYYQCLLRCSMCKRWQCNRCSNLRSFSSVL